MITISREQEENIDKLADEGIIPNKAQFIKEAISKHLNKSEIKKELKKLNRDKTKNPEKDKIRRIGTKFNDELEDIKKERRKLKKEIKFISNGDLTNMIPRHQNWSKIKEDLIHYDFTKK